MRLAKELWEYREMIYSLVKRDLKSRYKGSVLGFFWMFLNPLLQLVVYTIVFSTIMQTGIEKFYLFLFVALVPWLFFSTCLSAGAGVIFSQQNMVKKIYLIHRRDEFRGEEELTEKVKNTPNIEIIYNSKVTKLIEENGYLTKIEINDEKELLVKALFIYVGYAPKTDFASELNITNDAGYILVDENYETEVKGIYLMPTCSNPTGIFMPPPAGLNSQKSSKDTDCF